MEKRYEAFMLRLWQVGDGDKLGWRASLECPSSGELCGFASLDELFGYLRAITGPAEGEPPESPPGCTTSA